jgi:hypothetical protein
MKRIALVMSGNIRTFFYKKAHIAKKYLELVNKQNIDMFVYTDDNDINHNDIQYFSEINKNKVLGITNDYEKRLHKNCGFIDYDTACSVINDNLKIFGERIKKIKIEKFNQDQISDIYDANNICHKIFMNNTYSDDARKRALMCQFYKLYKCFELLSDYEIEKKFKYDIVLKSRFDIIIFNLNNYDICSLDLSRKIYTNGYEKFCADTWAIGDRFIMEKYCNYFLNISQNMVDNVYCIFIGTWIITNKENMEKQNKICENASDSGEFGLTYLIKNINEYDIDYGLCVSVKCFKFYEHFFNYFNKIN